MYEKKEMHIMLEEILAALVCVVLVFGGPVGCLIKLYFSKRSSTDKINRKEQYRFANDVRYLLLRKERRL